jgi:hypothetical protein
MSLLRWVCSSISLYNFHAHLAPVCHPTLRTDWFLKLGENNHTRALTVFRHVYEEYASNMSQPEDQCYGRLAVVSDVDDGGFALNVDKELRGSAVL